MILLLFSSGAWADSSIQAPFDSHTKVLAASCAACHGTNGNSVSGNSLAGLERAYFTTQMLAFRSGVRASTVMQRHAKGLTPGEIEQLGEYFSSQHAVKATMPERLRD